MTGAVADGAKPRVDVWTSQTAFLFATAAAAIGLGSLWRFPYVAGANGGGAFVIVYIAFVIVLCVPLMIAEMAIGRSGGGSAIASVRTMVSDSGASRAWRTIGLLSILIPFFGLSYYSVVAGWSLDYARLAIGSGFGLVDSARSTRIFDELIASPGRQAALQFLFIAAAATVVALGVQRGIETASKIKMTALFVVLIGLVIYNAVTVGLGDAMTFLFRPDFSALTGASILTALGQALFSTAIGVGVLMTYSAYLPRGTSLSGAAVTVSASVVFISIMAGLAIFPTVFAYGLAPAAGPNLIFVTLPVAFGQMPGGRVVAILFFSLISLAAFTTAVGMLEPVVSFVKERTGWGRTSSTAVTAFLIWIVGLPSLLSFNLLKDVYPLDSIGVFKGKTFFDVLDFGIAEFLLPLNALLIALFAGWVLRNRLGGKELDLAGLALKLWTVAIRIVAPIAIGALMIHILVSRA